MISFIDFKQNTLEEYTERLELVMERISDIASDPQLAEPYALYFRETAAYQLVQYEIWKKAKDLALKDGFGAEGEALNRSVFDIFRKGNYEKSYADPAFAVEKLGQELGLLLSAFWVRLKNNNGQVFAGIPLSLCIHAELFVELHYYFTEPSMLNVREIRECVRSFMHDYTELFQEDRFAFMLDAEYSRYAQIIMEADLNDPSYLYSFGLNVTADELATARKLAGMTEEEIQSMADTMTEGFRIGCEVMNKPFEKKKTVEIYYPLGFERVVRAAVKNYAAMGKECTFDVYSTSVNKQLDYDHKEDNALWMDKEFAEYVIECCRNALEKYKELAPLYAGPDVIEVFGEEPFVPEEKHCTARYDEKQKKLSVYLRSNSSRLVSEYVKGEERSFSIISYPVASIGEQYEEIFAETVKLNTLDYIRYRDIQQKLVDVLDRGDVAHIEGSGDNRTDLYVNLWKLKNPEKETIFENCVADINIPLGEVFTSPVLEGTHGKLHVTQVYLEDYDYKNLEIDFEDGMITSYNCTNFESEEQNKKYIEDNILCHHETLPMGEFAIGTNTVAYAMGQVYGIQNKLPILIAEKTGPHFAVGDTCYPYDEDNMTYNPDGKAIVARENAITALRHEDIAKAYYNCHTDITIPYNELKRISVIHKDGTEEDIIRDGRFVVPGTELLNEALDQLESK